MRQGLTVAPAGLVMIVATLGAVRDTPPQAAHVLDERFGIRTAPILLLTRPDVQLDLRLEPAQIAGARDTIGRLVERGLRLKNRSGPAVMAARRAIDEEMTDWLGRTLSGDQLKRLRQIDLQWEGASAILARPLVAEHLKLTFEQRLELSRILADRDARRAQGLLTPAGHEELSRRALGALNPAQKEIWDQLLGPACRFSFGGPARRGGDPPAHPGVETRPPVEN